MAIITEFSNSLNHEIGGEIAENLDALYHFMIRELTQANLHKDIEKLRIVDRMLVDLRATWGEAIEINRGQIPADKMLGRESKGPDRAFPDQYIPLSISR